jgi:hypothetical protein
MALLLWTSLARSRFWKNHMACVVDEVVHTCWARTLLGVMFSPWIAGRFQPVSNTLLHRLAGVTYFDCHVSSPSSFGFE